jgi:hypothetical protein
MAAAWLLLHQQAGAGLGALQEPHSWHTWHELLGIPMNQPMLACLAVLQAKLQ